MKDEVFWGIMEGKGWSFMWDAEYRRAGADTPPLLSST